MMTSMLKIKIDMLIMKLKVKKSYAFIINVTLLLLICACIAVIIHIVVLNQPYSVAISESVCFGLFDCTPSEFFDKSFDLYEETGDLREKSYVDERGNLMLIITEKQRKKLLKTNWINSFDELESLVKIETTSDCRQFTMYLTEETQVGGRKEDQVYFYFNKALAKMILTQLLNKIPESELFIGVTQFEANGTKTYFELKQNGVEWKEVPQN